MTPLDRKLLRDLWRIKGQGFAIALVIGVGVLLLVMMSGLVTSLDETRRAYYERYRLADVFAPVKRAPDRVIGKLAAIPGVVNVEARVQGSALVDLPGQTVPIQARAISLPDYEAPGLNGIYLSLGRRMDRDHPDEILLLKGFADANGLTPGDRLTATMNGARRNFRIVGLAQSPEFLYTTPPGEMAPDDSRFAVIWMSRTALAAAYDMNGAFNEALISLGRHTRKEAVIAAADRILDPHGGLGAYGLEDQLSNRFVSEEINGLRRSSVFVPPVFLLVAAFLLHIVVSRIVQAEREQIGLLKAFGYSSLEVGWHYLKLILVIAVGGALAGGLLGIASGRAMTEFYQNYFKFPFLVFVITPGTFFTGVLVSTAAAAAGGITVLRRIFALAPAVAMRPPAPADFSRTANLASRLLTWLDQPSRMVMRRIARQPWKTAGAVAGIAAGMALSAAMISMLAGFDRTIDQTFNVVNRGDVTVGYAHAASRKTVHELESIPGVFEAEPLRVVPVIFRNGLRERRGEINGLVSGSRLSRAVDDRAQPIALDGRGLVLSTALAGIMDISIGEMLQVEIREGRRPVLQIPVTGITRSFIGSPAYMELEALNRVLNEPRRMSGANLRIDAMSSDTIYSRLKNMPAIAAVSLKKDARQSLQELMDQGAGAMRYVMLAIAAIMTFGIVYNTARIAYAEQARDLASMRVVGFTTGETAFVLIGELAAVTLMAIPLGIIAGYLLTFAIAAGFSTDLYQIPASFEPASYGTAAIAILLASAASGWIVKRDMDKVELVSALKMKE